MSTSLEDLKKEFPELAAEAEKCFCLTDAIFTKLLLQKKTGKDYGLGNMLAVCEKEAGDKGPINIKEETYEEEETEVEEEWEEEEEED